jgi:hypothetical protein
MPTTPVAWALYLLGYYVLSRILLVLDDVFLLRVQPNRAGKLRNWWNETTLAPVVFYAMPFIGDVLALGMLLRVVPEFFGWVGGRLWTYRVARDAQAEEAATRAARVEAAVAQAKAVAEREVNAALTAEFRACPARARQNQEIS